MSKWPMVPLGKFLTQNKDYINAPEPREYPKLSVKLYGKGVVLDFPADGSTLKMKKHQLAKPGQVILSEIWGKKGAIGFVPEEGEGALCTSHFFLFDLDTEQVIPKWLEYIFKGNYLEEQLNSEARGTTGYAAVRPKNLLAATIPLPPLSEQQKIVEWIDAVATRVEEAKKLQIESDQLAQHVVQSSITTIFEEHLESDEDWKLVPLPDVATVARGKFGFRPRNDPRFYGGEYPFIQIGDISNSNRYIRQFSQSLNEQGLEVSRMFPNGTVVIAITGATIGATGILTFDSCFPDSIVGINALSDEVPAEYLYWALEYAKSQALAQATQTTQPNINLRILNTLQIPMSSHANLMSVVQTLDGLYQSLSDGLNLQSKRADEIDALVPSVLNEVFQGEGRG